MTDAGRINRTDALARLTELSTALSRSYRELAQLESVAHRTRLETWVRSPSTTITSRDREADWQAVNLTVDIITLKGEIRAWEQEQESLRFYIDHS